MMRSLFSGVAGLKTHQTKMDVIGNNIANVNTVAYKSSSITFSELMSQTTQKASGPNATTGTGGTNARQIGLGVRTGAINVDITSQGASQSTGNPFDIMITGENFFVVSNGTDNFFTRDGSFYVDGAGNLAMTSTGYNVMGWGVDPETMDIKRDSVTALRIMSSANMTYPPEATSKAYVAGILDKNDKNVVSANGKAINLNFYDSLGYSYTAKLIFKQSQNPSEYSVELEKILDSTGQEIDTTGVTFGATTLQEKKTAFNFDNDSYKWVGSELRDINDNVLVNVNQLVDATSGEFKGKDELTSVPKPGSNPAEYYTVGESMDMIAAAYGFEGSTEEFFNLYFVTDANTVPVTRQTVQQILQANTFPNLLTADTTAGFEADGRFFTGGNVAFDPDNGEFAGIGGNATNSTLTLSFNGLPEFGNFSDIEIDFSECSMFDNKGTSTLGATSGDFDGIGAGRRLGDMIGVSVQKNGMIYASYDNGMTKLLGQLATANFANASGLEKAGDNLYSATLNSGEFDGIGVDVTANGGYMSTGQLEMSNVDLSAEFTEMITTQRGFQANSRIITVSDTLLEELTNLKR